MMIKLINLKPCPNCGNKKIWRVWSGTYHNWWCECSECHWCGKTRKLRIVAEWLWNKESKGAANEQTDLC